MTDSPKDLGNPAGDWYWCFEHQRPEKVGELDTPDHMGPYPTPEAAEHWQDRVAERNESWGEDDE